MAITDKAVLRAPSGESWIICVCGNNTWFATRRKDPVALAGRLVCVKCKNEITVVATNLPTGHA